MGAVENFFTAVLPGRRAPAANPAQSEEDLPPLAPPAPSWGLSAEHLGAGYDANDIYFGERARDLDYKGSFFYARVHDKKAFDMNGTPLTAPPKSFPGSQGFLAQTGSNRWIPISQRRPNAPYRIPRTIVKSFTGMLFGQQRWPGIRSDDEKTQAWCEAVIKIASIRNRFTRGRNMGGAQGTVGFSWAFRAGKPLVRVHAGRFVQCLEWEDPDDLVPRHVTELFRTMATRQTDDGPQRYEVWVRRDWTPEADVVFKPVEATPQNPDEWIVDEERSNAHGDGFCHFVWAVNIPDDEDPSAVDGQPDYAELYEQMETLDGSNSVLVRGVTLNLDPTLFVKRRDPESVKFIAKGSDNSIVTDETGDAKYVTIDGGVVDTGEKLVNMQRGQILEVAQCIVADPDEVAAAGTSSLTMKLVYAPMIGATELLRETYGPALVRLLEQMQKSALRMMGEQFPTDDEEPPDEPFPDDEQAPEIFEHEDLDPVNQEPVEEVTYYLDLPKRTVSEPVLAEDGTPTGMVKEKKIEQHPGFGKIELEWGEYFPPTADDKQKTLTTLSASAGGRPLVSQKTAVEITAGILNKEATEEWERVTDESKRQRFEMLGPGGSVSSETEPPDGVEAPTPAEPEPAAPEAAPAPPETPPVETEPEFVDVQKQALNGAQVTSMLEVVSKVASDEIPVAAGIEILVVAFNMEREVATRIMKAVDFHSPSPDTGPAPVTPPEA